MSNDLVKSRILTVMRNLPPLPAVTQQLMAVMRDEDSSADDVTKVLSGDGILAGKVLKLVNSSFYGVPTEVSTISRAVVILGFTGIRNLALGFGTVEALSGMDSEQDMSSYWSHAMATAVAAQSLAPFVDRRTDPEEAFIAGLLHDIGTYVFAAAVPDASKTILETPAADRLQVEHELTGFTHAHVGQGLLKFWELPDAFSNAARYHHDVDVAAGGEQPLTNLVALADILACINGGDFETNASETDLQRLQSAAGIKTENLFAALNTLDEKIAEMADFMKIAGAGISFSPESAEVPKMTCVVVCTEATRRELVTQLLIQFGHETYPMERYFNQEAGSSDIGLVLVDPQSLSRDQIDRLTIYLDDQGANMGVLADRETTIPDCVSNWPTLNYLFCQDQLAQLLKLQPAR
ncbi:MAG: HDOD domain-containing protein [bacterium]|nr:HDOD domain-containing protein [bacterium]